jgi:uncharacterized OB-fold protein
MNERIKETLNGSKQKVFGTVNICPNEESNNATSQKTEMVKIKGILTSPIQLKGENKEPYYYAFIKLKGQNVDLPVIFKLTDKIGFSTKPYLKKGMRLELFGHYSNSSQSIRKSFTARNYRLSDDKVKKECFGCGDNFTCLYYENYDYCENCELNNSRYLVKDSKCSECDGSG